MPTSSPVYNYSVAVDDTRGLDPQKYNVTIVIERDDGEPLTPAECKAIKAAWDAFPKEHPNAPVPFKIINGSVSAPRPKVSKEASEKRRKASPSRAHEEDSSPPRRAASASAKRGGTAKKRTA